MPQISHTHIYIIIFQYLIYCLYTAIILNSLFNCVTPHIEISILVNFLFFQLCFSSIFLFIHFACNKHVVIKSFQVTLKKQKKTPTSLHCCSTSYHFYSMTDTIGLDYMHINSCALSFCFIYNYHFQ